MREEKLCEVCKKIFLKPKKISRFCSLLCSTRYVRHRDKPQNGKDNPNWKGGISKNNYRYKKRFLKKYPKKVQAHIKVSRAIKQGNLIKKPCSICGEKKVHGHHEDYSKPLEVVWLCPYHHREIHKNKLLALSTF